MKKQAKKKKKPKMTVTVTQDLFRWTGLAADCLWELINEGVNVEKLKIAAKILKNLDHIQTRDETFTVYHDGSERL